MEKKNYIEPEIIIEKIELEDIIASSGLAFGDADGDSDIIWPFGE